MNKRNSIILGLLFLVVAIEIVIFAPKDLGLAPVDETPAPASTPNEVATGQVMHGAHLIESKSGGKEWELWAERAIRRKENEKLTIEKVRAKFFAANGVTYTVTGQRGQIIPDKNYILIQGKVVTKSSNGYSFATDSVLYDSKSKRLVSAGPVAMNGANNESDGRLSLTGKEMIADLGSNEIAINKSVKAKKDLNDGKVATIKSDRALFSGKTNLAQFFGDVIVDVDTMRLTGPEAQFSYDRKSQTLESVKVGGGVKVTDTDKFATSNMVNLDLRENRVVFSGSPRVVQNGDELVGDEIVFLDGGKKIQVSNARAQIDSNSVNSDSLNSGLLNSDSVKPVEKKN